MLKREFFSVLMRHFPVGRVCSATSPVDFWSAECVLPHPWSFFSRQNVFCHLPGQFPVGRGGSEVFSGCQTSFSPIFPKTCYVTNERTYERKKIRLLKYTYAVNARDLKIISDENLLIRVIVSYPEITKIPLDLF